MTTPTQEELSPLALCTDEDVRIYLGLNSSEVDDEDRQTLIRLVNAASEVFTDESQRVWKSAENPYDRRYDPSPGEAVSGRLRIEDATEIHAITSFRRNYPAEALTPAAITDWGTFAPPGEPITEIQLTFGTPVTRLHTVIVSADWGWPQIPEKVRQGVIYTTAEWFARDVEKFSATFSVEQGSVLLPRILPDQVFQLAGSYRRFRVA